MATAPTTGEAPLTAPAAKDSSGRIARLIRHSAQAGLRSARSTLRSVWAARPRGPVQVIDVLRLLGLARRAVPRPVVGPKAYPQWWQRIFALLVLAVLVVVIGFVLAAVVGLGVVVAGFLLEQAIS